jgi:acyl dehydratase
MSIDYDALLNIQIPDVVQTYNERDTMLYALSIGYGFDPLNEAALSFCYERALKTAPTMPLVLAHPGFWMRDLKTGIDWKKVVHGEQLLELHQPLAPAATVLGKSRVTEIVDKGAGKGALVEFERRLFDQASGELLATMRQVNFCRADGGFGGSSRSARPPASNEPPSSAPNHVVDLPTRPEAALIYRLSADPNPLHVDPSAARAAGFPRPILHGLATFGIAGHALLAAVCGYASERIRSLSTRFTKPVFPGDTVRTEIWCDDLNVVFRSSVLQRNEVVLSSGRATLSACNVAHLPTER